ncbi:Cell division protein ZapA [Rickettsiales endosymbiont of Paramecium tredecaurelia]|uniref:cell division protein ZapA n=1 Tax=Candidatus Sarmatiella mevalonica TaxID=2770581 RepID=UPI00192109F3|nr:cell division protein ZapA [Candidatus Sarmatiella mevalonica]MBL3284257.1 Cell division protein ZapA [Candidatus Sarmatiella mevalonica]
MKKNLTHLTTIIINNKHYQLSCEATQERDLLRCASQINKKLEDIKRNNRTSSQELLLLMLSLSLQDEMNGKNVCDVENEALRSLSRYNNDANAIGEPLHVKLCSIAQYILNLAEQVKREE